MMLRPFGSETPTFSICKTMDGSIDGGALVGRRRFVVLFVGCFRGIRSRLGCPPLLERLLLLLFLEPCT